MLLSDDQFLDVIKSTPLVSIDILIQNPKREVLLGMRTNEPARGFYFTPGGRIKKNETIKDAFSIIILSETNIKTTAENAKFIGLFDHIYSTNKFELHGIGTHYVAAGYILKISQEEQIKNDMQHSHFRWFNHIDALKRADVHENTKIYIRNSTDG